MSESQRNLKTYSPPKLNKLTPEQGKLVLIGHATQGDQGARDLLKLLFPAVPNEDAGPSPRNEGEKPEGVMTRKPSITFRLFLPAAVALESVRQGFRRLVRG